MDEQKLDSQIGAIDDLLKEKLELAFHKQTLKAHKDDVAKIAAEHSPIDLAYAASRLPSNVRPVLYEHLLSREDQIHFLINTDSETRLNIFRYLNDDSLKKLFDLMPTDEVVWIVDDMPERRFRRVLDLIDPKKAARIREIKTHDRKSAGRLMSSEFFAFPMEMTIEEAHLYIRENPRIDFTKGVFVINEKKELEGFVPPRNLIINSGKTPLKQIMRSVLHQVGVDATREEVIDLVERYKISSLPVINPKNQLIGVIAYEDIVEAMEDLTDETIARIAGGAGKFTSHDPVRRKIMTRAPWLFVTLFAGLVNMGVMSSFEKYEKGTLTFAIFFVPLITGMSGNIGLQCSTILIRMMALGGLSLASRKEMIVKELLGGFLNGCIFGFLCGWIVYMLHFLSGGLLIQGVTPLAVSVIVGIGLVGSCFAGTLLGIFSPLFFSRIGVDPAVSAGPIVTAFNDFLSMTIYFLIAWGVSNFFF